MTYQAQIEKIVGAPVTLRRVDSKTYRVELKESPSSSVAWFNLTQLPGCCGVCVSYHATVALVYRCKGLGSILNKVRQQLAWNQGFTVLLCTDKLDNEPQEKILQSNGWAMLTAFTNRRTGNEVGIHVRMLKDSGILIGHPDMDYQEEDK